MKRQSKADTRRYARFGVLEYAIVFLNGTAEPLRSVIVDVGLGGIQILSKQQLPIGHVCHLTIGRSDGTSLDIPGEVRFSQPMDGSDLFSTGMRFAPETHQQRSDLVDYVHAVFQRQADQLAG